MDNENLPKPESKIPWNPILALVFVVLLYFIAPIIGGLLVFIYPLALGWTEGQIDSWLSDSVYAQFWFVLVAEIITVGALLLFLRRYKRTLSDIGLKKPRLKDAGIGLLAYPAYFVVFLIVVAIASAAIPGLNIDQEQELGFDNVVGALPLIVTFISLVVLPPFVEELLVRGFLYTSLRKWFRFAWAMLVTSLVFAAAHLPQGGDSGPLYIAAIDTFLLSVVLCYVREKTGTLWPGIVLHAIKNGVAFAVLFIFAAS
jgi:membrane protease YdiL (CAAX protease family)